MVRLNYITVYLYVRTCCIVNTLIAIGSYLLTILNATKCYNVVIHGYLVHVLNLTSVFIYEYFVATLVELLTLVLPSLLLTTGWA